MKYAIHVKSQSHHELDHARLVDSMGDSDEDQHSNSLLSSAISSTVNVCFFRLVPSASRAMHPSETFMSKAGDGDQLKEREQTLLKIVDRFQGGKKKQSISDRMASIVRRPQANGASPTLSFRLASFCLPFRLQVALNKTKPLPGNCATIHGAADTVTLQGLGTILAAF